MLISRFHIGIHLFVSGTRTLLFQKHLEGIVKITRETISR